MEISLDLQTKLVAALRDPAHFGAECGNVRLIETHISYVLLTGAYAYKIKKAIRLGFLDFTALARRRFYCDEELRLNRRLAPTLYLDVVAITGSVESPALNGSGPILDYAVRMREFPQAALLGNVLAQGGVTPERIDQLAAAVATFHNAIAIAPADGTFGRPDDVLAVTLANFAEIGPLVASADDRADLDRLEAWTRREFASRRDVLALRRRNGHIRECHGDLHFGNVALIDDAPVVFDCIEFNDRMRWIDVISEVAFTVMDLDYRGHGAYARRFLNAYLEATGDYDGIAVLRFYLVYRAMVRAKVAFLRAAQFAGGGDRVAAERDARDHLRLARSYAADAMPAIVVMHGFAGSGKTTASQALLERIGAIRLRTDVERKRLHGLLAHDRSRSGLDTGLYAPDETRKTYDYLLELARAIVASGFPVIVDGAFLLRWQRASFRALAAELGVPFIIVDVCADTNTLRRRVEARATAATDASEAGVAVLEHQLRTQETLDANELDNVVVYDAESPRANGRDDDAWRGVADRLRNAAATV